MSRLGFLFGFMLIGVNTIGQIPTLDWAKAMGGANSTIGSSVKVDDLGNVYTVGSFIGTTDFDPGAGITNLTSAVSNDIFVSKLDKDGNFVWAFRIGASGADNANSIALDGVGNLYITGRFSGTVDFDPGVGTANLTSAGIGDIFILKLDAAGAYQWAVKIGSTGADEAQDIAVDPAGNILVTGQFSGSVDFDPGSGITTLTSQGGLDIFITKFNNGGNFIWAKSIGSTSSDVGNSIATDNSGNVYTTGYFNLTVDFDPGSGVTNLTSPFKGTFISKLNATGGFVFAKSFTSTSSVEGASIAVDIAGNIYTTGDFTGTVDLDPGSGVFNQTEAGSGDIFISKLDASGNFLWAAGLGGFQEDGGFSIAVDVSGNCYFTGHFAATVDFDPGSGIFNLSSTTANAYDIFISKFDQSGKLGWAVRMGGPNDFEIGQSISLDGAGNVYSTGQFSGVADFDPGPSTFNLTGAGSENTFVLKLNPPIPTISNFLPSSGSIGTSVTITGTNFSTTPANNIVYFGATRAVVTAATTTQLTVSVPAGATYESISILVNGLTAYSSKPFTVTFADGGVIDACSFAAKVDVATGAGPYSIAIGDLDSDGKPDLAVANQASNTVSVFKNISMLGTLTSGSFASKVDFATNLKPYYVGIQDLDGDGKPELIVSNNDSDNVSIFKNISANGAINTSSFAPKVDFTTGENPWNITVDDFDLDGKPDLAIVNDVGNSVSVLKNNATPGVINSTSFAPKIDLVSGNFPIGIASGDLDGDGKFDIVTTNQTDNSISVFRNTSTVGSISFASKIDFATGLDPYSVSIGDLDANGKPEVIVANYSSATVSVYNNTSTSGAITLSAKVDFNSGAGSLMVALNDMDGDGKIDLTVSNGGNRISVLKNLNSVAPINGSSFSPPVDFLATNVPYGLAIGDLDGNGKPDIAAANSTGTTASLLQNTVSSLPMFTSTGFSPTSGPVGTTVIITGTNFSTTPLNNTIKFNGVTALVTASTSTSITAIVPAGATSGSISIQIGCVTAISIFPFTITAGNSIAIASQPVDLNVCVNNIANFTASATGTTNITYQWQFSPNTGTFSDISNGSSYSGVTTATLSVNTANNFGAGQYRCRINGDLASEVITNAASLSISACSNNQPPVIVPETSSVLIEGIVTIDLVPLISDPDNNLNLQSLQLVNNVSQAGATASINSSFELTLDYGGVLFSGNDFITISVCDLLNDCTEQELSIEVVGDIVVYNAISPNSDNKNEILYLKYIDVIPQTQKNVVSIYNRWGSKVFEVTDYDNVSNVFKGLSDNGNELPSGTYFYKIKFPNNQEKEKTGYLVLKR